MPYVRKKAIKRRRNNRPYRRRVSRRPANSVARPLRPAVYNFKRSYSEVVELNTQSPPIGWTADGNALCRNFIYKLSDLDDYLEFTSLFKQYKINAVRLQMYFSNTSSGEASNPVNSVTPQIQNANNQILMWICPNNVGNTTTINPAKMLQIQSAKKRTCLNGSGRPVNTFMRVKQLSNTYGGIGATDYAVVRPKYISTLEPHALHYGQSVCLERVDQSVFANNSVNYQSCRIIYTYYITTKQVS